MSESQRSLEEQIVEGVLRRLGRADQEVARAVAREVSEALPSLTSTPERVVITASGRNRRGICLLYTSPSPRDQRGSRMPSSA